jgi:hypothetical protein
VREDGQDANFHKIRQLETWDDEKVLILESKQIEQIKTIIPKLVLLEAVRKAEKIIAEQRREVGVNLRGVEDDGDLDDYTLGSRLGGSFEHILEHGLCAVLDQYCTINEQASGLTDWDRRGENAMERDDVVIYIAWPPSMTKEQSVQIIEKSLVAIQKQYKDTKNIDLLGLN